MISLSCFRDWLPGQPDNWGEETGEDCGQVAGSSFGQWNDENCAVPRKYICKYNNRKSTNQRQDRFRCKPREDKNMFFPSVGNKKWYLTS